VQIPKPLILILLTRLFAGAQGGTAGSPAPTIKAPVTPNQHNNRYNITYLTTPQSWKTAAGRVTSGEVYEALVNNLTRSLSDKGFDRVKPLDVQCCNVQLQILNAGSTQNNFSLRVRVTVLDVDNQTIYVKEYRGEGAQVSNAEAQLAKAAMADSDLLKAMAHR
jgi:hypothetical protein